MAQGQQSSSGGQQQQQQQHYNPVHFATMALRSATQVYDINLSAARAVLKTQARAAAAFGLPDMSRLFDTADERTRHIFSATSEQILNTAQRANQAAVELQRQVGRVIETQTAQATETWQRGLEEMSSQASQGLDQLTETARRTAEEAARTADAVSRDLQETMRRESQQAREQMGNGADQARQAVGQAGEAARSSSHQMAEEARAGSEQQRGSAAEQRRAGK
ncbi:MAG TPA: hypothetical protein VFS42_03945 [Burkholderiaceae bacterium]|nr:hypothetical protein [Burkholderiaceae bacterium]